MTHEERLAQALEELHGQRRRGAVIDWTQIDPALEKELRPLFALGDFVDHFAGDSRRPTIKMPAKSQPLPGAIEGYDLLEELGRGGMGVVTKAWDRKLERFVALKMVLKGKLASSEDLQRFQREATAAAGLHHPHIIPVFQVGEHEGQPYFSMKYIAGPSLAQVVAEGPLLPRRAAEILLLVAQAVQHAHEHGIIHRDLKPSNILLDGQEPIVTDFGLAKQIEGGPSLTGSGGILGTPSYMAPEQIDGNAVPTPTGDVYSLGAILYELLTGRPPFLAASPVDTLLLARSEEPVRPRLLNPRIDVDLEMICRKCLEKRPEHRYPSAAALAKDLQAFLAGEAVTAQASSLIYFFNRLFRDTHHAPVLENWGLLWMWHSLQLFLLCLVTSLMRLAGVTSHLPFLALWSIGLIVWGSIFWNLRRRGGPVTFVERQIAHAWAAGVAASIGIFVIEVFLGLEVLILSPVLAVIAGMIFLVKAGTLSGWFYIAAVMCFVTALPMIAIGPGWGPILFGIVSALGFFVPGLKYYRQRLAKM